MLAILYVVAWLGFAVACAHYADAVRARLTASNSDDDQTYRDRG